MAPGCCALLRSVASAALPGRDSRAARLTASTSTFEASAESDLELRRQVPIGIATTRIFPLRHETRFCSSPDGVGLAYATDGEGPPLVKAGNWMTHLEYDRQSPVWRHWVRELGRGHTLVRYDERGCGLSDREFDGTPTLDTYVGDLAAVVAPRNSSASHYWACPAAVRPRSSTPPETPSA
jgi:hypothetical protein